MNDKLTEICRLCFTSSSSLFCQLNLQDDSDHRKQLHVVFPEIDIDVIPAPVVCSECSEVLQKAYVCKSNWLLCEKRLKIYSEQHNNVQVSLAEVLSFRDNVEDFMVFVVGCNPDTGDEAQIKAEVDEKKDTLAKRVTRQSKQLNCPTCPKTFSSISGLRYHSQRCDVKKVGKDEENTSDEFDDCDNTADFEDDDDVKLEDIKSEDKTCVKCNQSGCSCEFPCEICEKIFISKLKLQRHQLTHTQDRPRPFQCEFCEKSFYVKSSLINHQATHADSREFLCYNCDAGFASKKYLQDHIRRVHLRKDDERLNGEFPCDVCLKVFNTLAKMKRHRTRHEERVRTHKCELCDQSFFTKSNLSNHMATHADAKEFSCEMCGLCFASRKYLHEHMRRLHNVLRRKPYKSPKDNPDKPVDDSLFTCDICGKKFTQKRYVTQHISTIHFGIKRKRIIKNLRCEMCGQIFTSNNLLTLHIRTHTGERPYKCNECDKSFAQASSLNTHKQAIHSNEKPYACEYCGKKFATKGMLLKHIQAMHIADKIPKNHKCSYCGKAFRTKSQMLAHMRWHTNDRRFSCDICGKLFINNACLKKHRAIHFDEKAHKCETCGKGFHQKFNLKIHMKVHMRIE